MREKNLTVDWKLFFQIYIQVSGNKKVAVYNMNQGLYGIICTYPVDNGILLGDLKLVTHTQPKLPHRIIGKDQVMRNIVISFLDRRFCLSVILFIYQILLPRIISMLDNNNNFFGGRKATSHLLFLLWLWKTSPPSSGYVEYNMTKNGWGRRLWN